MTRTSEGFRPLVLKTDPKDLGGTRQRQREKLVCLVCCAIYVTGYVTLVWMAEP
ncbi:hypothetical protein K504DRAFT_465892 [Pleomassaria siparia CBS 279.74]|uniref:Uncharacterized protein n=1 Tax=Pleomassaria siparia CBS 279.74 TaxID=1314801 RepID=A0A6G1KEE8_9PLEO|nr:hypothetical protein K504DRAFT_465892 [Pleomassaria siparia CBS 279.74]